MISAYARYKNRRILQMLLLLCTMLVFTACNKNTTDKEAVTIKELEEASDESEEHETGEAQEAEKEEAPQRPSREEVLAMRQAVTKGMSEEEIARITENIKVANLTMEKAYLYDSLFERLEDPEDLYWNYVDQKGEIQIGWDVSEKPYVAASGLSRREWGEKYGKIYVEQGTIGVFVNAVTQRGEEEMLLFPNMYLGLIDYPYYDKDSGKTIYECKLIKFY